VSADRTDKSLLRCRGPRPPGGRAPGAPGCQRVARGARCRGTETCGADAPRPGAARVASGGNAQRRKHRAAPARMTCPAPDHSESGARVDRQPRVPQRSRARHRTLAAQQQLDSLEPSCPASPPASKCRRSCRRRRRRNRRRGGHSGSPDAPGQAVEPGAGQAHAERSGDRNRQEQQGVARQAGSAGATVKVAESTVPEPVRWHRRAREGRGLAGSSQSRRLRARPGRRRPGRYRPRRPERPGGGPAPRRAGGDLKLGLADYID
jgi:hypothetical protein